MEFEHVAGCDRRHGRRQRCPNEALPSGDAPEPASVHAPDTGELTLRREFKPLYPALALGLWAFGGAILLGAILMPWRESSPTFPEWAHLADTVKLLDDPVCPDDAPWRPPCRTMIFGTGRPYEDVIYELRRAFRGHGWSAEFEYHDLSLHASRFTRGGARECILIYRDPSGLPSPSEDLREALRVIIDGCGVQ